MAENIVFHPSTTCDGCGMKPLPGIRYKCQACPNFDLCAACKHNGIHRHHQFLAIEKPRLLTAPPQVFHPTTTCDGCGIKPLPGIRYKCQACPDFDLCAACKHNGIHRHHQFLAIEKPRLLTAPLQGPTTNDAVHWGVGCDGCSMDPLMGTRYKCKTCPNYDLCPGCKQKGTHAHHQMVAIYDPNSGPTSNDAVHWGVGCDGCSMDPLMGTRYKCKTCPNYDLCPGCKQKGTHAHHQMVAIYDPNSASGMTQLMSNLALQMTLTALPPPNVHPRLQGGPTPAVVPPPSRSFPTQSQLGYNVLSSARWKPAKSGVAFNRVELDFEDPEFQAVVDNMQKRGGAHWISKINTISRVENYKQYRVYLSCKEEMERENGINFENERILWHGTAKDVLNNIYRDGFNRSYCGKNATAYGDGVYFAKDFQYSAQSTYSPPDSNGFKYIFQCRVLTGQFAAGSQGLKEPPMRNRELRYDSIVDKVQSPNMFVIFKDMQAYPEYVISLKC